MVGLLITLLVFIGGCVPREEGEGGFDWTIIIFLLLIFGVFYFLIIRPQRRRQKQHDELMQELYGVVESLSDDSVVLKIESGATIRVSRDSVAGQRER